MNAKTVLFSVSILLITGCANFNTIGRSTDLPRHGIAVHLDAPQRVVYSNKKGWVCAEPSPDALQAYASSLAGSFTAPSKESVSLALALSENSASIGLRTQAITLMRDALYRICELYYNKALSQGDVIQLLERSQDLSLGVLAIEQLTGAVVARQAMLTTGSNGATSANVNNTQAALDQARKYEGTKQAALATATATRDNLKATVALTTKEFDAAKANAASTQAVIDQLTPKLATEQKALDADKAAVTTSLTTREIQKAKVDQINKNLLAANNKIPKDQPTIDKLTAQLKTEQVQLDSDGAAVTAAQSTQATQQTTVDGIAAAIKTAKDDPNQVAADTSTVKLKSQQDQLKKDEDAVTAAQADYEEAQKSTQTILANLNSAVTAAQTTAIGAGTFSTGADRDNINKDTVAKIADASVSIVAMVVNKGHLTDTCANLMTAYFRNPKEQDPAFQTLLPLCKSVLETALSSYSDFIKGIQNGSIHGGPLPGPVFVPPAPGPNK
jgi:hypothetical protein